MDCRESEPSRLKHHVLLIRDGECNKHTKQESYFCAVADGGWGEWLSSAGLTRAGSRQTLAPVRPHLCSRTRRSLSLPLRGILSLLCPSQPSFATAFAWSNTCIALLRRESRAALVSLSLPPPTQPRARGIIARTPTHIFCAIARTHASHELEHSSRKRGCGFVNAPTGPSRVRQPCRSSRRVEYGPVRLAAGGRRGCEPESAYLRREAAPYQGAARCPRAALPGATQA
jgi:hypothetical protein